MDRDRGFNFKLLVPPRVNSGQVSAVRPQEAADKCGDVINTLQLGYSVCFDKGQNMAIPTLATPSIPARQDYTKIKVVPPLGNDENNRNPGELYTKLFDEVEKIKSWKVKADSDIVQKERRLAENRRTIETQRKAIQDLQFGNERLSIKLEEQISENEDLRNKNNSTRNLCDILKDTLQQSAEKMHLFESEREETNHLFMESNENIQKLIAAFESLQTQVEADQREMQKVKDGLLQFEELKEKYCQEYSMKEKEVAEIQAKLECKENELQKILLNLHETKKHSKQLEEETNQLHKLLKSSETEQRSLHQRLLSLEKDYAQTKKNQEATAEALDQSTAEYAQIIRSKDVSFMELSKIKNQQAETLEQIQATMKELENSLASEIQRARELEDELIENNRELERRNTLLNETIEESARKDGHIKILEDELVTKSKIIESLKVQNDMTDIMVEELTAELSRKTEEVQLLKNEAEIVCAEKGRLEKACEAAEKAERDATEKSTATEIKVQELEGQLLTEMKKNKEQVEQLKKDITLHRVKYEELLSSYNELQSEKMAIQQRLESGSLNVRDMKASEEKAERLAAEVKRLEEENHGLREEVSSIKTRIQGKCQEVETLLKKFEENCKDMQKKITEKEKQIKAVETKLYNLRKKFEMKFKAQEEYQRENKMLKKQIAKEIAKSSQCENEISSLQDECLNLKRLNEETHQKLLTDLEHKSSLAAELENEVQKLRLTTAEAIKNKDDAELKCQHKITDMVALMEKHKSQYDRMVEEKDAELSTSRKKEMETVAHWKSREFELSQHKTENDRLKKQIKTETAKMENLQKELTDLKKGMSSMKVTQLSATWNKQSPASNYKQAGRLKKTESVSMRHVYDFSNAMKSPSYSKDDGKAAAMTNTDTDNENRKPPRSMTYMVGGTSKIRSYRIRTPPWDEKVASWQKGIELDPKSDSSDQNDLLTFATGPAPSFCAAACRLGTLQKMQSPATQKSPGNLLKLAAMKRMRDAGWTAVTGCDKKKKKNEKIFA